MTKHDAIKHLSHEISFAEECDSSYADGVNIDALKIAVRAMAENQRMHTMLDGWNDEDELFVGYIRKQLKGDENETN